MPLRVQGGIPIERGMVSLKEYIDAMGPSARANAARIASVEAAEVLQLHVSNLFTNECSRGMRVWRIQGNRGRSATDARR